MKARIEEIIGGEGSVVVYERVGEGYRVEIEMKNRALVSGVRRAVQELFVGEGATAEVEVREMVREAPKPKYEGEKSIKRVIAVTSAKGGVGKSSVSVALARALRSKGLSVGVLDADIYGPSQPTLLGLQDAMPEALSDNMMVPPTSGEGIKLMSIGTLWTAAMRWCGGDLWRPLRSSNSSTRVSGGSSTCWSLICPQVRVIFT